MCCPPLSVHLSGRPFSPSALFFYYPCAASNLILEISEDGSDGKRPVAAASAFSDAPTASEPPSLVYQHTYDKRSIRWGTTNALGNSYPFAFSDSALPEFDQRLPLLQFCLFPDACPATAVVEVAMEATAAQYTTPTAAAAKAKKNARRLDFGRNDEHVAAWAAGSGGAPSVRDLVDSGVDAQTMWSKASISVALNGQDFVALPPTTMSLMVYDEVSFSIVSIPHFF